MTRDPDAPGATPRDRPPGALPRGYVRGEHTEPRPVWVDLTQLHQAPDPTPARSAPPPPDPAAGAPWGVAPTPPGQRGRLDFTREVIGRLHHFERDTAGLWYGLVDYAVPFRGDQRPAKIVDCGLVPAAALRPRDPHHHGGPSESR